MNENEMSGGWIWAFLIIALSFNGGGLFGGGNAQTDALATQADITNAINAQTAAQNQQAILLSSANNNYETARLIDNQTMNMMNQNNTNMVNAIQGFNNVNQNIATGFAQTNSNIADLGYHMDKCCCEIKTMLLENRLQDTQIALQNAQNIAVNAEQSQYLLSQMGKWTPFAPATATT